MTPEQLIDWMQAHHPTGEEDLDEAWRRVRAETPHTDLRECPLLRGLVEAKKETIAKLQKTT